MRINRIIWYHKFVEKIWDKHRIEVHEALRRHCETTDECAVFGEGT